MHRMAAALGILWLAVGTAPVLGAPRQGAPAAPVAAVSTQVVDKFRLPEFDANGVKKTETFGERAEILPDGKARIKGLRILVYRDGVVEGTLESSECMLDRKEKNAVSDADVSIRRGNMAVTGKGFRWSSGKQRIEILNDVKVVLQGAPVWTKKEKK